MNVVTVILFFIICLGVAWWVYEKKKGKYQAANTMLIFTPTIVSLILLLVIGNNVWITYNHAIEFDPRNVITAQTERELKLAEQYNRAIEDINLKTSTALSVLGIAITVLLAIQIKNWVDKKAIEDLEERMEILRIEMQKMEAKNEKRNFVTAKMMQADIHPHYKNVYYTEIIDRYPKDNEIAEIYFLRAEYYHNYLKTTKGKDEAIEDYKTAIDLKSVHSIEAYTQLGNIYSKREDWEAAENNYNAALKMNKNYVPARIGLSEMYKRKKRIDTKNEL